MFAFWNDSSKLCYKFLMDPDNYAQYMSLSWSEYDQPDGLYFKIFEQIYSFLKLDFAFNSIPMLDNAEIILAIGTALNELKDSSFTLAKLIENYYKQTEEGNRDDDLQIEAIINLAQTMVQNLPQNANELIEESEIIGGALADLIQPNAHATSTVLSDSQPSPVEESKSNEDHLNLENLQKNESEIAKIIHELNLVRKQLNNNMSKLILNPKLADLDLNAILQLVEDNKNKFQQLAPHITSEVLDELIHSITNVISLSFLCTKLRQASSKEQFLNLSEEVSQLFAKCEYDENSELLLNKIIQLSAEAVGLNVTNQHAISELSASELYSISDSQLKCRFSEKLLAEINDNPRYCKKLEKILANLRITKVGQGIRYLKNDLFKIVIGGEDLRIYGKLYDGIIEFNRVGDHGLGQNKITQRMLTNH